MAKGFERKLTSAGTENPKYVDLLEEDRPISGQKFTCVSFVSPENLLKQKNHFFFEEFLKHFDFTKSVDKFTQFLNFISYKHHLDFDKIMEDYKDFMKSEKGKLNIDAIMIILIPSNKTLINNRNENRLNIIGHIFSYDDTWLFV